LKPFIFPLILLLLVAVLTAFKLHGSSIGMYITFISMVETISIQTLSAENFSINPNPANVSVRSKPGFTMDQDGLK
jgi:hypothetical protein